MKVSISKGNTKLGKVANISLTPVKGCGKDIPCKKDCYALKSLIYPNVQNAWGNNLLYAMTARDWYFNQVDRFLSTYKGKFFRWHVAGDILDQDYYCSMLDIASKYPSVKFLAFTKQYDIVNSIGADIPRNLTIIFSAWPGFAMDNPFEFPVAFMQDGAETRLDGTELLCPGNCENCGMCWTLPSIGKNVVFDKH